MFFVFIICGLIFSVDFSSEVNLSKQDQSDDSKENLNHADVIKKSDLESLYRLKWQYMVKNYIEKVESYLSIRFVPNWELVDNFHSPDDQIMEIRRQKWEYILETSANSILVKRLNSELEKTQMNKTTFCKDMAEIYFTFSDNDYIFNSSKPSQGRTMFVFVNSTSREKTLSIFMNAITNCEIDTDKKKEVILDLSLANSLCQDAYIATMKKYYEGALDRYFSSR